MIASQAMQFLRPQIRATLATPIFDGDGQARQTRYFTVHATCLEFSETCSSCCLAMGTCADMCACSGRINPNVYCSGLPSRERSSSWHWSDQSVDATSGYSGSDIRRSYIHVPVLVGANTSLSNSKQLIITQQHLLSGFKDALLQFKNEATPSVKIYQKP